MKLKSLSRSANCCWSPEEIHSGIFLAAGTTAQQVDASFSVSSRLEILSLDISAQDRELKSITATVCDQRFHKLVWTPMSASGSSIGHVIGGTDNGTLQVYDVQRLLDGEDSLIASHQNHSGPVHALDFNVFQNNLLASGSRDSEIFIWDLNSPDPKPLPPGTINQPLEDIVSLAWNRQVQHIMASAMASRCVVWDLRKSEPIIRVSDSSSRFRCKAVAWNPQVATQMCLASEDDHCPWLQIWDLRYASSPVKTLEKHTKGVLSVSWNPKDQDMLVSCGKGGSVCIWNPNGAQGSELTSELSCTTSWNFEVDWCPRNPAIVSVSSLSGEVGIYSVIGGENNGGGESLKKAPSWLSGGIGAQFGFGGKLVTFSKERGQSIDVSQITTDDDFVKRVERMERGIFGRDDSSFWEENLKGTKDILWQFLNALKDRRPRDRFKAILGYDDVKLCQAEEDVSGVLEDSVSLNGPGRETSAVDRIVSNLVMGDINKAVELCVKSRRFAEALFLADFVNSPSLKESVRKEFLNANKSSQMCRLVACVSSGLWEELADLAPMDDWKTTVAAVLSHVTDEQRAANICSIVARRLRGEARFQEALLVSVIARDLKMLSECYISSYGDIDINDKLQDFMEVMTAARTLSGAEKFPQAISPIVSSYVQLLVEQGCLGTSLHFLNDLDAEDISLNRLRDRILGSQGLAQRSAAATQSQTNQLSRQRSRSRTLSVASFPESLPSLEPNSVYQEQRREMVSDIPVRPQSRVGKYPVVIDPSLKSSLHTYSNFNTFDHLGYNNHQTPVPQYVPPPIATSFVDQQPTDARSSFIHARPPSVASQPVQGMNSGYGYQQPPAQTTPSAKSNELPNGNDYTRDSRYSAPGWNDPPPIRRSSKPTVVAPVIPESPAYNSFLPDAGAMPENQIFVPQTQQFSRQYQQQPSSSHPVRTTDHVHERGPIPAEFESLYNTFEELRLACLVLEDGLIRKKLEDVQGKLEHFADKLRRFSLSENTIQNLQLIVDAVIQQDYPRALQLFSHVAQTCNMSETSAFLPGIKTLITVAQQNKIYA